MNTGSYGDWDPLNNQNFEKYSENVHKVYPISSGCLTLDRMGTIKPKCQKSGFIMIPKLGLEPKFHDPGTFGGFGKCRQTDEIHVL